MHAVYGWAEQKTNSELEIPSAFFSSVSYTAVKLGEYSTITLIFHWLLWLCNAVKYTTEQFVCLQVYDTVTLKGG